ncbi:TRAP transporter small permease [Acuticoccus kandeliae]|uniref:TRAP transporter small permease n=1 Tax=Acuticoccus kandeliae TaxID=2073160 RepID=UPI000D3EAE1D|nr:TRAP transporter small permease subunit [Acuticoccus kandeliae]
MARGAAHVLVRISDQLNRVALAGAILAVLVMALAATYQVVARYVFDAPPIWTEELARRAMVWAGMLGASVAFHHRADPTLFPAMAALGGGLGRVLALIRFAGVAIFAYPVLYFSLFGPNFSLSRGFLGRNLGRTAEMLDVSMIWFTAAVPLAFLIITIHAIAGLAAAFAGDPVATAIEEPQEAV